MRELIAQFQQYQTLARVKDNYPRNWVRTERAGKETKKKNV